ncbi:hypothetical protein C4G95_RS20920 [Vibrio parahaemolyticus]|nr:hypothetical protein [Vibrio parahaemolyticus]EJG0961467.1 hypothetical protein [Vibrio parahaemolyticus]
MIHLVSDCTHLTQCPKLLVQISGIQGPDGRMVSIAPGKRAIPDAKGRMRNK